MKRKFAVVAMTLALGLSACEGPGDTTPAANVAEDVAAPAAADPPAAEARVELAPASPAVPGAPDYAALYPGAVIEGVPTVADGVAGPGGLLTFSTEAEPQAVVDFYKRRAEASGLSPVMSMNQGEAIAYGAGSPEGATIQVVASPAEAGGTSVQLSWSAGE
ncbi:hypothetical protein [Brevundimonas variabilis]|uniref:Lipoprotein n=1 Tax=Brevundimonas variabilis TaxID=74312 RepID=A0A7W9FFB3_9CAUL|nr:hypothetical protein [Brevundimonas variabilis]MBB5747145.1 hypothetical protein [Brevundimonas variabilis]